VAQHGDQCTFSPSAGALACSRSIAFKIRCHVSAPANVALVEQLVGALPLLGAPRFPPRYTADMGSPAPGIPVRGFRRAHLAGSGDAASGSDVHNTGSLKRFRLTQKKEAPPVSAGPSPFSLSTRYRLSMQVQQRAY